MIDAVSTWIAASQRFTFGNDGSSTPKRRQR